MFTFIYSSLKKSLRDVLKYADYSRSVKIKYSTSSKALIPCIFHFHSSYSDVLNHRFRESFLVYDSFISEDNEEDLIKEICPRMHRMRYEYDHWDNAIYGFKEIEIGSWSSHNEEIIKRIRQFAFSPGKNYLPLVHVLDLAANGYIKAHIDSVRFCGDTIAGLSLLSDSIMRLVSVKHDMVVDILLKRRSLYIMRGITRFDFTHAILPTEQSIFIGRPIEKGRRVSIICRSAPES